MRLATILQDGHPAAAIVRDERCLVVAMPGTGLETVRGIAGSGPGGIERLRTWAAAQPSSAWTPLSDVTLGPAVPDPGAIYTVGLNYRALDGANDPGPERPLVFGKAPSSVVGQGSVVTWDRALTPNVDAEVELGVVVGAPAWQVDPAVALGHVFGYTCINDISSRDAWLDGDQWLLGKSMPGFCPVGPWVVTPDEVTPDDLRLGCTIDDQAIQDGRTGQMRFSVAEIVAFLSRHVALRPGDLIATGTPARLAAPPGPERRLQAGDRVTVWIERIGELTTIIA